MKSKLSILFFCLALLPLVILVQPSYAQQTGSLRIHLEPAAAVTAGARWRVDSGPWQNSGATVSNLSPDVHLVEFQAINGWTTQVATYYTIKRGETTTQTGRYSLIGSGYITCNINPEEARAAGMQWRPRRASQPEWGSNADWKNHGEVVANVPPGIYYIEIKLPIPGWEVTASQNLQVNGGLVATGSADFRRTSSFVQVTLEPLQARNAGARWRVVTGGQQGDWLKSGEQTLVYTWGTSSIEFSAVPGWVQPLPQQVQVPPGRPTLINIQGRYPPQPGTLQVTITPAEAVQAGAKWGVGSIANAVNDSGVTLTLPIGENPATHRVGDYNLFFKNVTGWEPEPGTDTVQIQSDKTTKFTKRYIRRPGNLTVTIEPARAREAGAQWRADGGAWQNSGSTLSNIAPGQRNIEFKEMTGWVKPVALQADIYSGETSRQTGRYTERPGSVSVTIEPPAAITAGAKWRAGQSAWQDSGSVVTNLTPGLLGIVFKDIDSGLWSTPNTINATITSDSRTNLSGRYQRRSGSLRVTIQQQDAVSAGAQWQVDGGAWQNSGTTIYDLLPGRSTVRFKDLPGFVTPREQFASITTGQNIEIRGDYINQGTTGIQVNITPHPQLIGAQWRLIGPGQDWKNSGTTMSGMTAGQYNIQFKQLDGWTRPPDQRVVVTSNQITPVTGTYTNPYGNLEVTITPLEATQAGIRWKVGNSPWQSSGSRVDQLSIGPCTIQLTNLPDWVLDPLANINIEPGKTTNVTVSFRRVGGSVTVTVQPAGAVSAGAQWRVDGGPWQNSGSTLSNVAVGQRSIEYKEIPGWSRPNTDSTSITGGQTITLVKNYTQQIGSLQVTIQGGDLAGMWQVDNLGWKQSTVVVNYITPGAKRIEFKDVAGWTKPAPIDVTIVSGQTQRATGIYTQSTGLLRVIIQPTGAEVAGARWRMDGGQWQASRQLLSNITVGPHQVEYSEVSGWGKPPTENVNIIGGQSTQITGTYQRR